MPIVSNEIKQLQSLNMLHDLDSIINRLTNIKMNLINSSTDLLNFAGTLDPNSPEMKSIERRRQELAAYEKKLDAELQTYQNRRKKVEMMLQTSTQQVQQGIQAGFAMMR